MPIFEYVCDKCDHEFETLQKVSEPPLKICEACGKKGLRKKISAAGFRLSGSGWYETDFKSGKNGFQANAFCSQDTIVFSPAQACPRTRP